MNYLNYIFSFIKFLSVWSIICSIIYFLLYIFKKDEYLEFNVIYSDSSDIKELRHRYPIIEEIELSYDINDYNYILLNCPNYVIKNINIYKINGNKLFRYNTISYVKDKTYHIPNINPNEYLLIRSRIFETIPDYYLQCRVNGLKVKIDFSFNGIYGNRSHTRIRVKKDLIGFLYSYFNKSL